MPRIIPNDCVFHAAPRRVLVTADAPDYPERLRVSRRPAPRVLVAAGRKEERG
jgi:hypothetical protein